MRAHAFHNFGGHTGRETPLPIPNREVKPARADGTRRATSRESRSPPIYLAKPAPLARASLVSGNVRTGYAARSFSRQFGSSARRRCTRSLTGGCVTNRAARPVSWNGLIVY